MLWQCLEVKRCPQRSGRPFLSVLSRAIGIALAALYVRAMSQLGWPDGSLALALAFGLCTNVLPWLLVFPAMGYGFFGSHGPAGTRLFLSSLLGHAFFGLGIWIGVRSVGLS
jgi:Protein of unknown function (DUF2938)